MSEPQKIFQQDNDVSSASQHTFKIISKAVLLACISGATIMPAYSADIVAGFTAKKQQNQVAFIPFAGDKLISSVAINDLNSTELKVKSRSLPQQAHSRSEVTSQLSRWKRLGIPYVVVGSTTSRGGRVVVEYEVIDVRTGRAKGGKQVHSSNSSTQDLRYSGHVIADKIYELVTGTKGDFSGRIAYVEERGRKNSKVSLLKVMDADGKNARTLTSVRGSIFSPAWSPDGRTLAYSVQYPRGLPVIYTHDVDGGRAQLATPYKGMNLSPSFSPSGGSILFSSSFEGNADIYRLRLGARKPTKVVSMKSEEVQPSYAPNGRSFLFVSNKLGVKKPQIYRYSFGSRKSQRISRNSYATSPSFSPDGKKIAFLNGRRGAIMNLSGQVIKTFKDGATDEAPTFSPNGKRVVYASRSGITIRSLNGGSTISKNVSGRVRSPSWSKSPK